MLGSGTKGLYPIDGDGVGPAKGWKLPVGYYTSAGIGVMVSGTTKTLEGALYGGLAMHPKAATQNTLPTTGEAMLPTTGVSGAPTHMVEVCKAHATNS